ncbi:MAG: hypothetical protein AAF438_10680 [Pseudomonadota bacterium]
MARQTHKIAALFCVVWGLLHLKAARLVYSFAQRVEVDVVQGRLFQDAGFLLRPLAQQPYLATNKVPDALREVSHER